MRPRILHDLGLMTELALDLIVVSDAATIRERTYTETAWLTRLDTAVTPSHIVLLTADDGDSFTTLIFQKHPMQMRPWRRQLSSTKAFTIDIEADTIMSTTIDTADDASGRR